jgi:mannosyltransferase
MTQSIAPIGHASETDHTAPPAGLARRRPVVLSAVVVGVLAAVLSAIGSWIPSLWGDEGTTMLSATRPLSTLLPMLAHVDAVHGLYYVGMHVWTSAFGSSPFALRLPSALAVGACCAVVVFLTWRFLPLPYAVIAGIIAATLPRLTFAGEEARSYAFDALLATVLCLIVVEIMRRHPAERRWWVAYGVTLGVGVYLFFYLALMGLAVLVMVLLTPSARPLLRRWTIVTGWTAVGCLPMLALAILERNQIAFLATQDAVTPYTVFVGMWFQATGFAWLAWALILVALGAYVFDAVRGARAGRPIRAPRLEVVAACWLILPMGILIAVNPVYAGFTSRYATFAAPAAAILMAVGIRRIAGAVPRARVGRRLAPAIGVTLAVVVVVSAMPVWAVQRTPYAKNNSDWNEIAATIHQRALPGDGIVFDEGTRPSRRPRLAMDTNRAAFANVTDLLLQTPYVSRDTWYDATYSVAHAAKLGRFDGVTRVWVVEYADTRVPDRWGLASLTALGYQRITTIREHTSVVYLYTR